MKKFIILLLIFLIFCNACNSKKNTSNTSTEENTKSLYQKISADEAHKMMQENQNYILLDVRTEEEFKEKRIEGALLIPDYEINRLAKEKLTDKKQLILIYCRSGRRSANAANELIRMGYTNVYDFGGIIDWPYNTVNGKE